jgi:hypothetical protein
MRRLTATRAAMSPIPWRLDRHRLPWRHEWQGPGETPKLHDRREPHGDKAVLGNTAEGAGLLFIQITRTVQITELFYVHKAASHRG